MGQFPYFPVKYWPINYMPVNYWPKTSGVVPVVVEGQPRKTVKRGAVVLKLAHNDDDEVLLMYMEM